ncbi:hypothetical protein QE381_002579 [Microbacterium sp. SORGH_AS 888]|nr:hypothetical protein [Microbacterium sp. SORGH_AS_0888]
MAIDQWIVADGPLAGSTYTLDAEGGQILDLTDQECTSVTYCASARRLYGSSNQLLFVGHKPPIA